MPPPLKGNEYAIEMSFKESTPLATLKKTYSFLVPFFKYIFKYVLRISSGSE